MYLRQRCSISIPGRYSVFMYNYNNQEAKKKTSLIKREIEMNATHNR